MKPCRRRARAGRRARSTSNWGKNTLAYRVLYRKRAERDLDKLAEHATPGWFADLCDAVESLAEFPNRGSMAREAALRKNGVRQLPCGEGHSTYRILYRVWGETVQILTIRHGHRRPIRPS
ncbi:MAG: type II toxin-antitoxin system RelE/ParE family toxin [Terriglobia bacterium]